MAIRVSVLIRLGALLSLAAVTQPSTAQTQKPFSHLQHAPLNLPCSYCHAGAETALSAGFPEVETCRNCHPKLAERAIPEAERVYRIPDFVFFSHARHIEAAATCADCHGEVAKQAKIELARPTTMLACIACHQERQASIDCNLCHDLGQ